MKQRKHVNMDSGMLLKYTASSVLVSLPILDADK